MKMKRLAAIFLVIVLFLSNGLAVTIGKWQGAPGGDANHPEDPNHPKGTGYWKEAYWNKPPTALPPAPCLPSDEIKVVDAETICVLDSDAGNYICKLTVGGGPDFATAPELHIVKGGHISIGEFRIGPGGISSKGAVGRVTQTGGTLNLNGKFVIGRHGTSDKSPNNGKGYYTISGGTISYSPTEKNAGLFYLAASGESQEGAKCEGTFTIIGKGASINVKSMYIGNDLSYAIGVGTLEYIIDANGISPIKVADRILLDGNGDFSTAALIISAIAEPPKTDMILAETQGTQEVFRTFDTVNGNPAPEGAEVVLSQPSGKYYYKLTYKGGAGNNDIILKFDRFEPAAASSAQSAPAAAAQEPNKTK